ncbi:MAG: hypothetical protein E6L05_04510 [Thaumarchaeota archaeon]|nr:MAG: hypothetical protein E6L05_04510 [Nitrososphaerota archaeon]
MLGIVLLGIIVFPTLAYAQTASEFSYRLLPDKIVANTEGVLQVYVKGNLPTKIDNLIASSSDSHVIQITGIEQNKDGYVTNVKIKAVSSGTANIALAAPGFTSQEFSITIYSNNITPANLLIKTTPSTFSMNEATQGYVTVELGNQLGIPFKAKQDTSITLTTTDSNIINLKNTQLTIKQGEYFAIGQFEVKKDGSAQISASTMSLTAVSSAVTVSTTTTPQTIQLFVFPTKINNFQNSYGYVIAQLHNSAGNLALAKEDITIPVQVTDSSKTLLPNTSGENPLVSANAPIVIKKGSYWGFTTVSVNTGVTSTYDVSISPKGYMVTSAPSLQTTTVNTFADNSAVLDLLPILATGQKELIGIMHLEDTTGNPIMAADDLQIEVVSSDTNSLSIDKAKLDKGTGAALVFGKVGTFASSPTLKVITLNTQTLTSPIIAPTKESVALVAEPLLPKILSNEDFPLALYLKNAGVYSYFTTDVSPIFSPRDIFLTESKMLQKDQSIVLFNSKSLKPGPIALSIDAVDYATTTLSLDSSSSAPASISLAYPEKIISNFKNTFSMQLLDSQQNPVFMDKDTQIKLVSSDPSILDVPENVVIKQGDYYSFFNVNAKQAGNAELAVLANDIPLSKFEVVVTSVLPTIGITSNDYVNPNTTFDAALTVQYNNAPMSGLKVDWSAEGAKIQSMDSVTDNDGKAKITLLSQDPNKIDIKATVSGGIFSTTSVDKQVTVNQPLTTQNTPAQNTLNTNGFSIFGINPLFIVIPAGAAGAGIILKKKNMLDGITQKINLLEKVSEIKERITTLREK